MSLFKLYNSVSVSTSFWTNDELSFSPSTEAQSYLSSHFIWTQPGLRRKDQGWYHFSTALILEHNTSSHRCSTCSLTHTGEESNAARLHYGKTKQNKYGLTAGWLTLIPHRGASETWRPSARVQCHGSCWQTALPEMTDRERSVYERKTSAQPA